MTELNAKTVDGSEPLTYFARGFIIHVYKVVNTPLFCTKITNPL